MQVAVESDFSTLKSLIIFLFQKNLWRKGLLELFGKQFGIEGESGLLNYRVAIETTK
jgi:hypothetical protein